MQSSLFKRVLTFSFLAVLGSLIGISSSHEVLGMEEKSGDYVSPGRPFSIPKAIKDIGLTETLPNIAAARFLHSQGFGITEDFMEIVKSLRVQSQEDGEILRHLKDAQLKEKREMEFQGDDSGKGSLGSLLDLFPRKCNFGDSSTHAEFSENEEDDSSSLVFYDSEGSEGNLYENLGRYDFSDSEASTDDLPQIATQNSDNISENGSNILQEFLDKNISVTPQNIQFGQLLCRVGCEISPESLKMSKILKSEDILITSATIEALYDMPLDLREAAISYFKNVGAENLERIEAKNLKEGLRSFCL